MNLKKTLNVLRFVPLLLGVSILGYAILSIIMIALSFSSQSHSASIDGMIGSVFMSLFGCVLIYFGRKKE